MDILFYTGVSDAAEVSQYLTSHTMGQMDESEHCML